MNTMRDFFQSVIVISGVPIVFGIAISLIYGLPSVGVPPDLAEFIGILFAVMGSVLWVEIGGRKLDND